MRKILVPLEFSNIPDRWHFAPVGRFVVTKTYTGSCHCGAVRFEADIDLSAATNKCNCSICTKTRNWNAIIKQTAFRILAGENELIEHPLRREGMHHLVCPRSGVRPVGGGEVKEIGGVLVRGALV